MGLATEIEGLIEEDRSDSPGQSDKRSGLTVSFRQLLILIPILGGTSLGGGVYAAKATDAVQDEKIHAIEIKLEKIAVKTAETTVAVGSLETAVRNAGAAAVTARTESREDLNEIRALLIEALK